MPDQANASIVQFDQLVSTRNPFFIISRLAAVKDRCILVLGATVIEIHLGGWRMVTAHDGRGLKRTRWVAGFLDALKLLVCAKLVRKSINGAKAHVMSR